MRRSTVLCSAVAATAALGLMGTPAIAQVNHGGQNPVTVSGEAVCGHAGPVGRYTVVWTLTNATGEALTIDNPATETGTVGGLPYNNTVTFAPETVPAASPDNVSTGSDGPITGTTTGTINLSVDWSFGDPQEPDTGTSTATVTLAGDCVNDPGTTAAPTTTARPQTTVAAVVASPTFTG